MTARPSTAEPTHGAAPGPTEHAIQLVGPGRLVHNRAKPVPVVGPHQVLAKVEAVGICFSDTKLMHQFTAHPRKSEVLAGLDRAVLAEIPSYVPGELPTVPGHEVACRIVAVGDSVARHRVGERCLVQTDYRHLPTASANAAFGYNFEGGLQEYVLLDERVIVEPETGERFLIPVSDGLGASAVALVEPWACVECSYAYGERQGLLPAGRTLIALASGHAPAGLRELLAAQRPSELVVVAGDDAGRAAMDLEAGSIPVRHVSDAEALPAASFDDLISFGADAGALGRLQGLVAPRGLVNVVTGGRRFGAPVSIDVGRVHYDLVRWTGTHGSSPADGYAAVPADGELRTGDRMAVIGAAGPMGLMHVVRAITLGVPGLSIAAVDIDEERLAHLAATAASMASERSIELSMVNSRRTTLEPGFDYIAVLVPAPALVADAVRLAGLSGRINIFAGFATGTRADIDLDRYLDQHCYFLGTSGSRIPDMRAVLDRLERGDLDTNVSVDGITGMEGVADALEAVEARSFNGKIVVYPQLHELGLLRLSDLPARFPGVVALLQEGAWTRQAESELLRSASAADS